MDIYCFEQVLDCPYEKKTYRYEDKTYNYEETSIFRKELYGFVETSIKCFDKEKMFPFGSVDVSVMTNNIQTEHKCIFENLIVPTQISRRGIGTALMLKVLDYFKVVKRYYGIKEEMQVSGWLSKADNPNNWNRSLPLYEKVGRLSGLKTLFVIIDNGYATASVEEFLEKVGSSEGRVVYYV